MAANLETVTLIDGRCAEVWYDLDLLAGELWIVAGPAGWKVADIDPDALPAGFRWITDAEWEAQQYAPGVL